MQKAAADAFRADMEAKLAKRPDLQDKSAYCRKSDRISRSNMNVVIPGFAVCCRRLTPGPGYLEALCEENVRFLPIRE